MNTNEQDTGTPPPDRTGANDTVPALPSLLPHHREHLHQSGLTDDTIDRSGAYSIEEEDDYRSVLNLWSGAEASVPALAFPYPGMGTYTRVRPDDPRRPNPAYHEPHDHEVRIGDGHEPRLVDGPKYVAPREEPSRLYIQTSLRPEILDASVKLWLVEGEKKALAACQAGLAAVAAPGVTCFGNSAARQWSKGSGLDVQKLHADFERFHVPLSGRDVVICFDNDIDTNTNVALAAARLGKMLAEAGAIVEIAYLPAGTNGDKVGLDDLLAALPEAVASGSHPLAAIEDSVRPFNVYSCVDDFLADLWDTWTDREQDLELARAVRLACCHFKQKHEFAKWQKHTVKALRIDPERVAKFVISVKRDAVKDPRAFVSSWMSRNGVEYEARTEQFRVRGRELSSDLVFRQMALDAVTYGGPSRQALDDAFAIWLSDARRRGVDQVRHRVRFRPEVGDAEVCTFVRAVTGSEDPVDMAVMKHFVWQVKRKVFDLAVAHHLMPIFCGPQGGGKSVAIRKLLHVVGEFVDEPGDLTCIADERQAFRLANAFVMFFDEMAKAQKVDVDSLKNRITEPTVRWRVLSTNRKATDKNRATFIGATNMEVPDLVSDTTGLRRFYQVNCLPKMNWDLVNAIDYDSLWASVDESGPCPLLGVMKELQTRQEEMRLRDAAEEFLEHCCIVGGDVWVRAADAYVRFKVFLDYDNRPRAHLTSAKFGRRLHTLLGSSRCKKSNGVWYNLSFKPTRAEEVLDEAMGAEPAPTTH